jgi:hypothetical protein
VLSNSDATIELSFCYGLISHDGGGGQRGRVTLHTSNTLRVGCSDVISDIGDLTRFASHGGMEGGAVQRAVNGNQKLLKGGVRNDGTWRAQWHLALYA